MTAMKSFVQYILLFRKPERKYNLRDEGVEGRMLIKVLPKKIRVEMLTGFIWLSNELSGYIKGQKFIDQVRDY
jgi:hypothetical protein